MSLSTSELLKKWQLILKLALKKPTEVLHSLPKHLAKLLVARDAGLSRESLYKALSGERSPGFDTILKVIGALGLKLHAEASQTPNPPNQHGRCAMKPGSAGYVRRVRW